MSNGATYGGIATALAGIALSGSGKRDRRGGGINDPSNRLLYEALARSRAALGRIEGMKGGIAGVFGVSPEEIAKRKELISTGAARTTEDVIDSIRAEAARSGVTNAPGFVTGQMARARGDIGFQRLGAETSLDEAIRGGKQQAFGTELGIEQFLSQSMPELAIQGAAPQYAMPRSQTFGHQIWPALAGFGGQLAGYGLGSSMFGGSQQGASAFASTTPDVDFNILPKSGGFYP